MITALFSLRPWAVRIRREREARGWSVVAAVDALLGQATKDEVTGLPSRATLKRRWHEWEAGDHLPGDFYQPLLAGVFGTLGQEVDNPELVGWASTDLDCLVEMPCAITGDCLAVGVSRQGARYARELEHFPKVA